MKRAYLSNPVLRGVIMATFWSFVTRLTLLWMVALPMLAFTGYDDHFAVRGTVYTVLDGAATLVFGVLIARLATERAHDEIHEELMATLNERRK